MGGGSPREGGYYKKNISAQFSARQSTHDVKKGSEHKRGGGGFGSFGAKSDGRLSLSKTRPDRKFKDRKKVFVVINKKADFDKLSKYDTRDREEQQNKQFTINVLFNAVNSIGNKLVSFIDCVDFVFIPEFIKGTFVCIDE